MTTNRVYEHITATKPKDLKQMILQELKDHIGSTRRIQRRHLVEKIAQRLASQLEMDRSLITLDRQVRQSIEDLQLKGYPIISDSGQGGYWMAETYAEREAYIAEIESRANKLMEKARKLRSVRNQQFIGAGEYTQANLF
jgi:hypothetical protein